MKKKLTIAIPITLVAVIAITVIGLCLLQEMKQREDKINYEYTTESTRVFALQEPVVLDSEEDEKGLAFGGYVANLPWQGSVVLTIVEAAEYSTLKEASLDTKEMGPEGGDDGHTAFVVLKMKLLNKSASSIDGGDRFNIATFVNLLSGDPLGKTGDIVYFDGTAPDADPHKGMFEFVLGKNEERVYTVAVKVVPEELKGDVFVAIGLLHYEKYKVNIGLNGSL